MNPLDKQCSRLPEFVRKTVPLEQQRLGLQTLNALTCAVQSAGEAGAKRWTKKNMTPEAREALVALADAADKDVGPDVRLGALIRLQLQMLDA